MADTEEQLKALDEVEAEEGGPLNHVYPEDYWHELTVSGALKVHTQEPLDAAGQITATVLVDLFAPGCWRRVSRKDKSLVVVERE